MTYLDNPDTFNNQPWVSFEWGDEPDLHVVRRCPQCGRFVTVGKVFEDYEGTPVLKGWRCKAHQEIEPFWLWDA